MAIYAIKDNALVEIGEKPFNLEREIQSLFEKNLKQIMGVKFLSSGFVIRGKKIDTLAYDAEVGAFVIVEYMHDQNLNVVEQAFTYQSLMLENQTAFLSELNRRIKTRLKLDDVNWNQTKIGFVSPSFTENQIQATKFKDIAFEFWEIRHFKNNLLWISLIKSTKSAESIKQLKQKNKELRRIAEKNRVYTEATHLSKADDEIVELYKKYKSAILKMMDGIKVEPKKRYVAFKTDRNIVDIEVQKKSLKIHINLKIGALNDHKGLARDVSKVGHYGNGDYQIQVEDDKDLEYTMSLIKQAV